MRENLICDHGSIMVMSFLCIMNVVILFNSYMCALLVHVHGCSLI